MRSLITTIMQCTLALLLMSHAPLDAAPSSAQDYNLREYAQHRSDAEEMEQPPLTTITPLSVEPDKMDQQSEAAAVAAAAAVVEETPNPTEDTSSIIENPNAASSLNKTSVLILIRDALKKVTTVLPTEQVATNALQYFQLFEHFIQQTIERVIEDYDEEDEEATTIKSDEETTEKVEMVENNEINLDSKDKIMTTANEIEKDVTNQIPKEPTPTVQPAMEMSEANMPSS